MPESPHLDLRARLHRHDAQADPPLHAADEREGRTAYVRDYTSEHQRRMALADFLNHYNHDRPHTALGGRPLISRTGGSDYRVAFDILRQPLAPTGLQQLTLDDLVTSHLGGTLTGAWSGMIER
ncbi:integrase core domain-containing protein [Streptomyces sp. NPDC003863]